MDSTRNRQVDDLSNGSKIKQCWPASVCPAQVSRETNEELIYVQTVILAGLNYFFKQFKEFGPIPLERQIPLLDS